MSGPHAQASGALPADDAATTAFLHWAASHGCVLAHHTCALAHFPAHTGMGRGLLATRDLGEDERLFVVPRGLLLSLRTSVLGSVCAANERAGGPTWGGSVRPGGWAPLILSMMWEAWRVSSTGREAWARMCASGALQLPVDRPAVAVGGGGGGGGGGAVEWGPYFDVMPTHFDAPMLWADEELAELQGTDVLPRVGRKEADDSYASVVRPYIAANPHIFLGLGSAEEAAVDEGIQRHYSLAQFHLMGSRVLSRSFHVKDGSRAAQRAADRVNAHGGDEEDDESDDEEDEEEEDTADISMVPMADLLNARYGADNARLFFKPDCLEMRTTAPIPAGAQIFNTFGDPPNGDLLRRYGHVDEPNGADAVDLEAALIGEALCELAEEQEAAAAAAAAAGGGPSGAGSTTAGRTAGQEARREGMRARVAWLCDSEHALLDDAFPLTYLPAFPPSPHAPYPTTTAPAAAPAEALARALDEALEEAGTLPEEVVQCVRALGLGGAEFEDKVRGTGRLPSAKLGAAVELASSPSGTRRGAEGANAKPIRAADVLARALHIRLRAYATPGLEEDEAALLADTVVDGDYRRRRRRAAIVVRLGEKRVLWDHIRALEAVARRADAKEAAAAHAGAEAGGGGQKRKGEGARANHGSSKKHRQ